MVLPRIFADVPTDTLVPGGDLDDDLDNVASMAIMPCTASGTNTIALLPFAGLPVISAYADYLQFAFQAAFASTGNVTVNFAGLGALPWYQADGTTQMGAGNVAQHGFYVLAFVQSLNSGAGGFIAAGALGSTGPVGPNSITNSMLAQMAAFTIKGNKESSTHNPEDLTVAQTLNLLVGTPTPGDIAGTGISITGPWGSQTISQVVPAGPIANGTLNVEGDIDSDGTVLQSLGIASVTRNGSGQYTVFFTTPFDGDFYACVVNAHHGSGGARPAGASIFNQLAGQVDVVTWSGGTPGVGDLRFSIMASGAQSYVASAVHFDGTTFLTITGALTGAVASPDGSGSVWVNIAALGDISTAAYLLSFGDSPTNIFDLLLHAGGTTADLNMHACSDPTPTAQVTFDTNPDTYPGFATWVNILWSIQTNHGSGAKIGQFYFNDVAPTQAAPTDADGSFSIGWDDGGVQGVNVGSAAFPGPSDTFLGDMADFWFAPGQFIDFSIVGNRRKFITAGGAPVFLGATGELPTGTAPAVFFTGGASSFGTNKGTGGTFATTGTLTNASSHP